MGGPPGAQDPVGGWTVISVLVATQTCYLLLSRCWQGPSPHRTGKAMGMIPGLDLEHVRPGLGVGGRSGEHVEGGTLRPQGREVWKGLSRGQGSGQGCVGARRAFHVTGSCCRALVGELARLSHSHVDPCLQANASAMWSVLTAGMMKAEVEALKTRCASQRMPSSTPAVTAAPACWHQQCSRCMIPWLTGWMPSGGHCLSGGHCPPAPAPRRCRSWAASGAQAVSTNAESPQPWSPRASVLTTWPKREEGLFSQSSHEDDAAWGVWRGAGVALLCD